jgi:hypothetical protein
MKLNPLVCLLGLGVAVPTQAYAQEYFNCQYSPRCEAIQNRQCEPDRNLKDKLILVRLHNSAEEVERTWLVLAGLEPEYCGRLGARGNVVREFVNFRANIYPKLYGGSCGVPQACAEAFVKSTREAWERDDLDAKIKADLERNTRAAMRVGGPADATAPLPPESPAESIVPESWETTTEIARPTRTTRTGTASSH